ncbi:hypothetical protein BH23CHL2_BH23CHL2_21160 [soil metagenome]
MHRTRITRTNGSLSFTIPEDVAERLNLSEGDTIDLDDSQGDNALILWLTSDDDRASKIAPERAQRIEAIMERRRAMLESLAQR